MVHWLHPSTVSLLALSAPIVDWSIRKLQHLVTFVHGKAGQTELVALCAGFWQHCQSHLALRVRRYCLHPNTASSDKRISKYISGCGKELLKKVRNTAATYHAIGMQLASVAIRLGIQHHWLAGAATDALCLGLACTRPTITISVATHRTVHPCTSVQVSYGPIRHQGCHHREHTTDTHITAVWLLCTHLYHDMTSRS